MMRGMWFKQAGRRGASDSNPQPPLDDRVAAWLDDRGRREVAQLLFLLWDPIGVSDELVVWNEYVSYVDELVRLATDGYPETAIASRMREIAATMMEIETGDDLTTAITLQRWVAVSMHAWESERQDG